MRPAFLFGIVALLQLSATELLDMSDSAVEMNFADTDGKVWDEYFGKPSNDMCPAMPINAMRARHTVRQEFTLDCIRNTLEHIGLDKAQLQAVMNIFGWIGGTAPEFNMGGLQNAFQDTLLNTAVWDFFVEGGDYILQLVPDVDVNGADFGWQVLALVLISYVKVVLQPSTWIKDFSLKLKAKIASAAKNTCPSINCSNSLCGGTGGNCAGRLFSGCSCNSNDDENTSCEEPPTDTKFPYWYCEQECGGAKGQQFSDIDRLGGTIYNTTYTCAGRNADDKRAGCDCRLLQRVWPYGYEGFQDDLKITQQIFKANQAGSGGDDSKPTSTKAAALTPTAAPDGTTCTKPNPANRVEFDNYNDLRNKPNDWKWINLNRYDEYIKDFCETQVGNLNNAAGRSISKDYDHIKQDSKDIYNNGTLSIKWDSGGTLTTQDCFDQLYHSGRFCSPQHPTYNQHGVIWGFKRVYRGFTFEFMPTCSRVQTTDKDGDKEHWWEVYDQDESMFGKDYNWADEKRLGQDGLKFDVIVFHQCLAEYRERDWGQGKYMCAGMLEIAAKANIRYQSWKDCHENTWRYISIRMLKYGVNKMYEYHKTWFDSGIYCRMGIPA